VKIKKWDRRRPKPLPKFCRRKSARQADRILLEALHGPGWLKKALLTPEEMWGPAA